MPNKKRTKVRGKKGKEDELQGSKSQGCKEVKAPRHILFRQMVYYFSMAKGVAMESIRKDNTFFFPLRTYHLFLPSPNRLFSFPQTLTHSTPLKFSTENVLIQSYPTLNLLDSGWKRFKAQQVIQKQPEPQIPIFLSVIHRLSLFSLGCWFLQQLT